MQLPYVSTIYAFADKFCTKMLKKQMKNLTHIKLTQLLKEENPFLVVHSKKQQYNKYELTQRMESLLW